MRKIAVFFILLLVIGLGADILHVPSNYHYISLAILAAVDGDTILVAPGNYSGVINLEGKDLLLTSNYLFSGNMEDIYHTTLRGNYSDTSLLSFENGESEECIVNGFTITNEGSPAQGGAVYCDNSSPVFRNIRFIGNQATSGGALFANQANPQIEDCEFNGNSATEFGGAIYLEESELTITASEILNSVCDGGGNLGRGGGIFVSNSSIDVSGCVISDNEANAHAGGIYLSYGLADIEHTLFSGNVGGGNVGGIYFYNSERMNIINCTFYDNSGTDGGALRFYNGSGITEVPVLLNTLCWGNTPVEIFFSADDNMNELIVSNCDIEGGEAEIVTNDNAVITWLDGNIDIDPEFISAEDGHYYLEPESGCIDSGVSYFEHNSIVYLDTEEYMGVSPDIGGFESDSEERIPLAKIFYDTELGEAPLVVNFEDESIGEIINREWDFDHDGEIDSIEENPGWTYEEPGIYSVYLKVYSDNYESEELLVDVIEVTEPSGNEENNITCVNDFRIYPNPFNPITTVKFTLAEDDKIDLSLYSVKGEYVRTIKRGNYNSGEYVEVIDGEGLASGIYILKLESSREVRSLKIALLK